MRSGAAAVVLKQHNIALAFDSVCNSRPCKPDKDKGLEMNREMIDVESADCEMKVRTEIRRLS